MFKRYVVPEDLAATAALLKQLSAEIYRASAGGGNPDFLRHLLQQANDDLLAAHARLSSEGRVGDIAAFQKHLFAIGTMNDNRPYRNTYVPFVRAAWPIG